MTAKKTAAKKKAKKAPEEVVADGVKVLDSVLENVGDALATMCGPKHRMVQHRDGKPPWCPECQRTATGQHRDALPGIGESE